MYFLFSSLPVRPKCLAQMLVLITLLSKPTMQSTYCCRLVKWLIFDSNNLLINSESNYSMTSLTRLLWEEHLKKYTKYKSEHATDRDEI